MKKQKLWMIVPALAVAVLVGSMVAYLTSAEKTENVFTIGEVTGSLTEPGWDRETDPGHNLVPDQTVVKDPVITNKGKNSAYVFLRVMVPLRELTLINDDETKQEYKTVTELFSFLHGKEGSYTEGFHLYDGTEGSGNWVELTSKESYGVKDLDTTTYVFGYRIPLEPGQTTETLFDAVRIANYLEGEISDKDTYNIVVEAYMIQASYVEDENGADITVRKNDEDGESAPTTEEEEELLTRLYEVYVNQNGNQDYDLYRLGVDAMATDEKGWILEPERPQKAGYTFVGWYDESATAELKDHAYIFDTEEEAEAEKEDHGITFPVDPETLPEGGLTIYPGYVPIVYTIRFHSGVGTENEEELPEQTFYYDESGTLMANPFQISGLAFAGWSFSENGNINLKDQALVRMEQLTSADVTELDLYAVWKSTKAKIQYHATEGAFSNGMSVNEVQIVSKVENGTVKNEFRSGTYMEPEHVAKVFDCWCSDASCADGTEVTVDKNGVPTEAVGGDQDLYARWKYPTVTYVLNSTENYQVSYEWENGENVPVSNEDLEKETMVHNLVTSWSSGISPERYDWSTTGKEYSADFDLKKRLKSDLTVSLVKVRNMSCTKSVTLDYTKAQALKNGSYDPDTVKYAVTLYGIQADQDENGSTIGLTFGPATGSQPNDKNTLGNYNDAYVSHSPWGTTAKGNAHRCIHDDSWEEIIDWGSKDPQVYEQCLSLGIRKDASGNGDGAGVLKQSVNAEYLKWNVLAKTGTYSDLVDTNEGGWPASRIRAVLNGAQEETADGTHATVNDGTPAGTDVASMTEDDSLLAAFPEELKAAIVKKKVKSDTVCDDAIGNNVITYDKLWLASGSEFIESSEDYDAEGFGLRSSDEKSPFRQHEGVGDTRETAAYTRQHNMGIIARKNTDDYLGQKTVYDEAGKACFSWLRTLDNNDDAKVYYLWPSTGYFTYYPTNGYGIGISPFFCVN